MKNFTDFNDFEDITAGAVVVTREDEVGELLSILTGCLDEIARNAGWFGSPEMIADCSVEGNTAYYEAESKEICGKDGYLLIYMMQQKLSPYLLFGFSENDVDLRGLKPSDFQFSIKDVSNKSAITSRIKRLNPEDEINYLAAKIRIH
jgi:hypothetical protein